MGLKLSKIGKSIGKAVKSGVKAVVNVTVGVVSGEYLLKAGGSIIKFVGNEVIDDALGLDKLGSEWAQVGTDIEQVGKVLGGDYHDDMKEAQYLQQQIQDKIYNYNRDVDELSDRINSLIAFHEIFKLSATNRLDSYIDVYGPELESAIAELKKALAHIQSEYDFVIGLTQGAFLQKMIGSVIMIIGGLMSDIKEIASGEANSDTWQRTVQAIIMIVAIVYLWWNPGTWLAITSAVMATIGTFMALDTMYANGAATGAMFGALDFLFNDLLNLDDVIGSDFNKFDSDHADYEEMVMYTKVGLTLAAAGAQWANGAGNYATASAEGTQPWSQQTAMLAEQNSGLAGSSASGVNLMTDMFGINGSSFSSIYDAYSAASKVNDVMNQKKAYDAMVDKFSEESAKVEEVVNNKYRKNFMKHYKDTSYFLQDQQEFVDRYVWGMTAESMYVDPYGTTPVANIRFTPDKDTRVMSFGFEDVFNEGSAAGSKGYFNSILYGN